jgi:hypothetical protein
LRLVYLFTADFCPTRLQSSNGVAVPEPRRAAFG